MAGGGKGAGWLNGLNGPSGPGGLCDGCEGGKGGHCRGSLFGPGGGGGPGGLFPEGPLWGRGGHLGFGGRPPLSSFSLLIHNTSENVGLAGSCTPNHRGGVDWAGYEVPSCCIVSAL